MLIKRYWVLKKQFFLLSIIYTLALTTVCLIKLNNLPDIKVSNGDKIFHLLAYLVLTFLWVNTFIYKFKLKKEHAIVYAGVFCIAFGIIIEVLQGSVTSYRSSDIYDVVANTCGVLIMILIFVIKNLVTIKK
jgi:VanZ family protein